MKHNVHVDDVEPLTIDEVELLYPGSTLVWRNTGFTYHFGADIDGTLWCLYVEGDVLFTRRYWTGFSWRIPRA